MKDDAGQPQAADGRDADRVDAGAARGGGGRLPQSRPVPPLREAVNVDDLKERDRLVRRLRKQRRYVEETKAIAEHWNAAHPDEEPINTEFEDAMLAHLDGKGPMPLPDHMQKKWRGE